MKSEGYAPEQFPFQTFVNSSDYQSYIWFLLQRKKQKQGRKSYQKNNPYLPQKTEKMEVIVHVLPSKKYRLLFIHSLRNPA